MDFFAEFGSRLADAVGGIGLFWTRYQGTRAQLFGISAYGVNLLIEGLNILKSVFWESFPDVAHLALEQWLYIMQVSFTVLLLRTVHATRDAPSDRAGRETRMLFSVFIFGIGSLALAGASSNLRDGSDFASGVVMFGVFVGALLRWGGEKATLLLLLSSVLLTLVHLSGFPALRGIISEETRPWITFCGYLGLLGGFFLLSRNPGVARQIIPLPWFLRLSPQGLGIFLLASLAGVFLAMNMMDNGLFARGMMRGLPIGTVSLGICFLFCLLGLSRWERKLP